MLPFGVTIPATVPQGSEIPEGLMNNPVYIYICRLFGGWVAPVCLDTCSKETSLVSAGKRTPDSPKHSLPTMRIALTRIHTHHALGEVGIVYTVVSGTLRHEATERSGQLPADGLRNACVTIKFVVN